MPLLDEYNLFERGNTVLDVGCSDGRFAKQLVKHQIYYYGFDIRRAHIKEANRFFRELHNFHFRIVDIHNSFYNPDGALSPATFDFPYATSQFDTVLASSLFTHLHTEEIAWNYMSEVKRVLHPGGKLYITFFSDPPNKVDQYPVGPSERTVYSMEFIDELTNGFSILHVEGGQTTLYNDQLKMVMRKI